MHCELDELMIKEVDYITNSLTVECPNCGLEGMFVMRLWTEYIKVRKELVNKKERTASLNQSESTTTNNHFAVN